MGVKALPEYQVYQVAKQRCTNPNSQRWKSHGGRGIRFLFESFHEFIAHIGRRPDGDFSLERIDNDGHYVPGNVKWATRSEQQKNKRKYAVLKRNGKGCYWHAASGKWLARVKFMGTENYLGLYNTEEDARAAYNRALDQLKERYEQNANGTSSFSEAIFSGSNAP